MQISDEKVRESFLGDPRSLEQTGPVSPNEAWSGEKYDTPMTERKRKCRSRVRILAGSSRRKVFRRPAMAWGSQYSSDASRSTSPSEIVIVILPDFGDMT